MGEEKEDGANNIKVAVRCRPFSKKEIGNNEVNIFHMKDGQVVMDNPKDPDKPAQYNFDHIYPPDTRQCDMYQVSARSPVSPPRRPPPPRPRAPCDVPTQPSAQPEPPGR
jgi:hypothetical protein